MKTEEGRVSHLGTVSFRAGGERRAGLMSSGGCALPRGQLERARRKARKRCQAELPMGSWQLVC